MASVTIRNLDPRLKERLRLRAARHGRSMEEELRVILRITLEAEPAVQPPLSKKIRRRFRAIGGGVELVLPSRDAPREPPRLA
jgi:antitoxin FitA